nr:histidine kinase [uncultured Mediterraneibacter sp.]
MERLERNLAVIETILNSRKKRHIAGGVLLSMSVFFGGLAITVMTIKQEDIYEEENEDESEFDQ